MISSIIKFNRIKRLFSLESKWLQTHIDYQKTNQQKLQVNYIQYHFILDDCKSNNLMTVINKALLRNIRKCTVMPSLVYIDVSTSGQFNCPSQYFIVSLFFCFVYWPWDKRSRLTRHRTNVVVWFDRLIVTFYINLCSDDKCIDIDVNL